jgi:hypothetical protein
MQTSPPQTPIAKMISTQHVKKFEVQLQQAIVLRKLIAKSVAYIEGALIIAIIIKYCKNNYPRREILYTKC